MHTVKKWVRVFLSGLQAIFFLVPCVLQYYGSHRMGAHRHLKVRGDVYLSGILSRFNLTIAAIVVAVILVLLLFFFLRTRKHRPQPNQLWSMRLGLFLTLLLILLLILPEIRTLLIFPWLLLCAGMLWLMQLIKLWLMDCRPLLLSKQTNGNNHPESRIIP
jgi:hypothetical protein